MKIIKIYSLSSLPFAPSGATGTPLKLAGTFYFMENEIWKDLNGFDYNYLVSDLGNLKNKDTNVVVHKNYFRGYVLVNLMYNGKTKTFRAHRLIAKAFIINPFKKSDVNHINGVKDDNRVINLEWATPSENLLHAFKNGLHLPIRKLTVAQVKEIRDKYYTKSKSQRELAEEYSVCKTNISNIVNNIFWKTVK